MIEQLAEDAVAMVGGGDDEGLNIFDDIRDIFKIPRIDGTGPDEFSPV